MKRCFRVHPMDNVATLLEDAEKESVVVVGGDAGETITLTGAIKYTHKVALTEIPPGGAIVKFGIQIGTATQKIQPGDWIHLHNCASGYDERSGSLEVESGQPTDTIYV
jgi:altronate dehydratase small subunit